MNDQQRTMRAAVIAGPARFEVHEIKKPEPGAHEVRIKVQGCCVCASSLPLYEGRVWFTYPEEPGKPGHEVWGVIDAGVEAATRATRSGAVGVICARAGS